MNNNDVTLDFENLKVVTAVGRGAKGVVFLARTCSDGSNEQWLALKLISKAAIQKKNKISGHCKRVSFEQQILRCFDHPLLPRLRGVLETKELYGFAIDYCHGGTMHSLRRRQYDKTFSNDAIRFYAVELVLSLEYLHNLGVVYRDLKPENILIQETGHIMLVDFDLSKRLNPKSPQSLSANTSPSSNMASLAAKCRRKRLLSRLCYCHSGVIPYDTETPLSTNSPPRQSDSDSVEKSNSFVGTEDYVAPEVILGEGHEFSVDWWSLGVVLYEMYYGTTPFKGANRKETFQRILTKEPDLKGETTPLKGLILKLLEKDPNRRIVVNEIKHHDFFKGVKWDTILQIARPPHIPNNEIEDRAKFSLQAVESFVHGIFFPKNNNEGEKSKQADEKKNAEKKNGEEVNSNCNHNNKSVWVDKLNHNPTQNENFLIF